MMLSDNFCSILGRQVPCAAKTMLLHVFLQTFLPLDVTFGLMLYIMAAGYYLSQCYYVVLCVCAFMILSFTNEYTS